MIEIDWVANDYEDYPDECAYCGGGHSEKNCPCFKQKQTLESLFTQEYCEKELSLEDIEQLVINTTYEKSDVN